jgi:hypothetical protein
LLDRGGKLLLVGLLGGAMSLTLALRAVKAATHFAARPRRQRQFR